MIDIENANYFATCLKCGKPVKAEVYINPVNGNVNIKVDSCSSCQSEEFKEVKKERDQFARRLQEYSDRGY